MEILITEIVIPETVIHAGTVTPACSSCYLLCGITAILLFIYLIVTLIKPENF